VGSEMCIRDRYALDAKLTLKAGATKPELERAMKSHILGEAELMGRYGR